MQLPVSTYDNEDPSSTARLINCYPENLPPDARGSVVLRRCPGIKHYGVNVNYSPPGPLRMMSSVVAAPEYLNLVFDNNWISEHSRVSEDGGVLETSDVNFSGEYIDWTKDQNRIVFTVQDARVALGQGWFQSTTANYGLGAISDADFTARGAAEVEFLDNYFIFREPGTARFFASDVGDYSSYTSTSFATAEAAGDLLVGMKATRANLLLFGEQTIEIWDAVGSGAFPFRRIINGAIDKGCINGRTVAEINDQVFWVADDKTVRVLSGMEPVKISNYAIDRYMENSNSLESGRAFTYSFSGHDYYVLRFSDRCFVYDLTVGTWHERKTIGSETWAYGMAECAWGKTLLGRDLTPKIYQGHQVYPFGHLSNESYYELEVTVQDLADNGYVTDVPMVMSWTYQPVWGNGQRVFHDRLEIVVQTGVGNADETDPVIDLEASDDGGQTWQSLPSRAMGAQGKHFQRVVWHNLGSSYQRVYRASVSAPVPVRVMSTELQARGGRV